MEELFLGKKILQKFSFLLFSFLLSFSLLLYIIYLLYFYNYFQLAFNFHSHQH